MHFYCQLDYEHVPYPSPMGAVNGNLANNGCGVCSASMLVENMLDVPYPPEVAAKEAKACGAREGYGTNLYIFAPVFAAAFGMKVRDTEDGQEALRFLQEGRGMVIANTYGDRPEHIGVFSDSGHYIVVAEAKGTEVKVWDPMYKLGSDRFEAPGRKGKVRVEGNLAYVDIATLAKDCDNRYPSYALFRKK